MKRRILTLIFIAGVAILMIAGYFIFKAASGPQNETSGMMLFEATGISKISCVYQGETTSFVKKDGIWFYEPDASYPLNTAYLRDMESALLSVTASQMLEDGSFEEYGLADPTCVIEAIADDGREFNCELGDDNDTANVVYTRFDGHVYVLDDGFSKRFRHTLLEMASRDKLLNVDASDVSALSLTNKNGFFSLTQYPDGVPGAYSNKLTWAFTDGSYGDSEVMKQLVRTVGDMQPTACVSYQPNGEALESYGFMEPDCSVDIKSGKGELIVQIGRKNEDGQYYVYLPESKLIYTFDPEAPEALLQYRQSDCMNRYVFLIDYSGIGSAEVEGGGVSRTINFADEAEAWDFYYALSTMRAEAFANETINGHVDIVLTVYMNVPDTIYTLNFSKYNEDFYSVSFQDDKIKLVNKRDVENLLSLVKD